MHRVKWKLFAVATPKRTRKKDEQFVFGVSIKTENQVYLMKNENLHRMQFLLENILSVFTLIQFHPECKTKS